MKDQELNASLDNKKNSILAEICDWIDTMLFAVLVIMLLFIFIVKQISVVGTSMEKTLLDNDRILVSSNLFYSPDNGDIIVSWSEGLSKNIVKRIIAKEGQTVDIDFETGKVYVDGNELREPYINNLTTNDEFGHSYPVTVPKDCYFVMGDNRQRSEDSRSAIIGFVHKDDILGKAILRISPINRFGGLYD